MSQKLSAIIITFNEERNIEKCLLSLKNVADEIIVLDSLSSDRTKEICLGHGVKFHEQKWLGYSEQKNKANSLAEHDLIFSIDADEVVSNKLEKALLEVKESHQENTAYNVARITNYCGKWIRYGGWYPDIKLRIWNRTQGEWSGELHEEVKLPETSQIKTLKGDLEHYSYHSINQHIAQFNKFTEIGALDAFNRGKRASIFNILLNPTVKFLKDYIFRLGFLDGYYGFVISIISSFATFTKYIKMYQLQKESK